MTCTRCNQEFDGLPFGPRGENWCQGCKWEVDELADKVAPLLLGTDVYATYTNPKRTLADLEHGVADLEAEIRHWEEEREKAWDEFQEASDAVKEVKDALKRVQQALEIAEKFVVPDRPRQGTLLSV